MEDAAEAYRATRDLTNDMWTEGIEEAKRVAEDAKRNLERQIKARDKVLRDIEEAYTTKCYDHAWDRCVAAPFQVIGVDISPDEEFIEMPPVRNVATVAGSFTIHLSTYCHGAGRDLEPQLHAASRDDPWFEDYEAYKTSVTVRCSNDMEQGLVGRVLETAQTETVMEMIEAKAKRVKISEIIDRYSGEPSRFEHGDWDDVPIAHLEFMWHFLVHVGIPTRRIGDDFVHFRDNVAAVPLKNIEMEYNMEPDELGYDKKCYKEVYFEQ